MKNFLKISGLINDSKDILDTFDFDPPSENLKEDSNNNSFISTNSNSIFENFFLITEEKLKSLEKAFPFINSEKRSQ